MFDTYYLILDTYYLLLYMNIGIDASRAFTKEKTGTEEYSYQLIKNLAMMDTSRHQIFLYARKNPLIDFDLPDNFQLKIISIDRF